MSYHCPICKDQKIFTHEYPEGHSRFESRTVTVIEYCQCQGHLPNDSDYRAAQGVCDRMGSDGDFDQQKEYIKTLHPMVRDRMAKIYSIKL